MGQGVCDLRARWRRRKVPRRGREEAGRECSARSCSGIGLSITDAVAFGSLGVGQVNIEDDVITIPLGGNINYDGNTFTSLFDGTGGFVGNSEYASQITNGTLSYTYANIATLFDGTGGYVQAAFEADSSVIAIGPADAGDFGGFDLNDIGNAYQIFDGTGLADSSALFNGSGGWVLNSSRLCQSSDSGSAYMYEDIASLFDGTGGSVDSAVNATNAYNVWDGGGFADAAQLYNGTGGNVLSAEYTNNGEYYLSSLFDGSGGNVYYAENADLANTAGYASSTGMIYNGTDYVGTQGLYEGTSGFVEYAMRAKGVHTGNYWEFTGSDAVSSSDPFILLILSGTTASQTLTLSDPSLDQTMRVIKNRSSQTWTIASGSGSQIYSTSAQSSVSLSPGASLTLASDGTYWNVIAP